MDVLCNILSLGVAIISTFEKSVRFIAVTHPGSLIKTRVPHCHWCRSTPSASLRFDAITRHSRRGLCRPSLSGKQLPSCCWGFNRRMWRAVENTTIAWHRYWSVSISVKISKMVGVFLRFNNQIWANLVSSSWFNPHNQEHNAPARAVPERYWTGFEHVKPLRKKMENTHGAFVIWCICVCADYVHQSSGQIHCSSHKEVSFNTASRGCLSKETGSQLLCSQSIIRPSSPAPLDTCRSSWSTGQGYFMLQQQRSLCT